jgi:hypothetical protein
MPLPPNTLAELQRDMARLGFVVRQIGEIEQAASDFAAESPPNPAPIMTTRGRWIATLEGMTDLPNLVFNLPSDRVLMIYIRAYS